MVKPKKLTSAGYILNEATNHRRVTFLNELIGQFEHRFSVYEERTAE